MENFNSDDYKGEIFLNRLYKDFHLSDEVMHTVTKSDTKNEKLRKYLNRLERIEFLAVNSNYNGITLLKNMYYQKYVIKEENIPQNYFKKQANMALDRGLGHVEFSQDEKNQMIKNIIEDQKKSLDTWLDYFLSDDSMYPEWFKYYAFQGMIKLGSYDKKKGSFSKRTENTTNIFVDLNREALALIYDELVHILNGRTIDDKLLQKLLEDGSFSKLYAYMIAKLDKERKYISDSNEGIWVKYDCGSNPDKLVDSLKGKGTGWCIAGIKTAENYLKQGDFYIYYTKDFNGEYRQPRIAIRMKGNSIEEIRGIAEKQNLESEMEEVLNQKLEGFSDREKYYKKVKDMEKLTSIYKEYQNRRLTVEELRFLYEVDREINGFGYEKDPRIQEIIRERNFKEDLALIFDCSLDEISDDVGDVLGGKSITCFYGDLNLEFLYPNLISFPSYVLGNLSIYGLTNIKDITFSNYVKGYLDLSTINTIEGCIFPNYVGGDFLLNNADFIRNSVLSNYVGGDFYSSWAMDLRNVDFPEIIEGNLYLNNLTNTENVRLPSYIGKSLNLGDKRNVEGLIIPVDFQYQKLDTIFITMQDLVNKSLKEPMRQICKKKSFSKI